MIIKQFTQTQLLKTHRSCQAIMIFGIGKKEHQKWQKLWAVSRFKNTRPDKSDLLHFDFQRWQRGALGHGRLILKEKGTCCSHNIL